MGKLVFRSIGADGDPWPDFIRNLRGQPGSYVIREHGCDGEVVYVGSAGKSLYDTITRHFQQWKRNKQWWRGMRGAGHDPGLTYRRSICCVGVVVTRPGLHRATEAGLIRRLKPRDNLVQDPSGEAPF